MKFCNIFIFFFVHFLFFPFVLLPRYRHKKIADTPTTIFLIPIHFCSFLIGFISPRTSSLLFYFLFYLLLSFPFLSFDSPFEFVPAFPVVVWEGVGAHFFGCVVVSDYSWCGDVVCVHQIFDQFHCSFQCLVKVGSGVDTHFHSDGVLVGDAVLAFAVAAVPRCHTVFYDLDYLIFVYKVVGACSSFAGEISVVPSATERVSP